MYLTCINNTSSSGVNLISVQENNVRCSTIHRTILYYQYMNIQHHDYVPNLWASLVQDSINYIENIPIVHRHKIATYSYMYLYFNYFHIISCLFYFHKVFYLYGIFCTVLTIYVMRCILYVINHFHT